MTLHKDKIILLFDILHLDNYPRIFSDSFFDNTP